MRANFIFGVLIGLHGYAVLCSDSDRPRNKTCSTLGITQADQVVFPTSENYDALRKMHWSQTAYKNPDCIFTPNNVDALRYSIKLLQGSDDKFAVRSGGHSPLNQWANIDGGILISLRRFTELSYDPASKTVRVGSGNTWGQVYEFLKAYQRIIVGGRSPTVGFGLLVGGGLSHLSNLYGWVGQNVVEFEVVLADGKKVMASESSNKDLFWALKGGGTNFGIITHVTMKTYPTGKVWGGLIIYPGSQRDALMGAFADYQRKGQLDRKSAVISYLAINNDTLFLTLVYFDNVVKPPAFDAFYSLPALVDATRTYDDFSELINGSIPLNVPRWTWGSATFFLDKASYVEVGKICQNATSKLSTINGGTMVLLPQPISKSMVAESNNRGPSPLTVESREQLWFCINMGWNLASDDANVAAILTDTLQKIDTYTKKKGLHSPFVFMNDAFSSQDPLRSYGPRTFQRLQQIGKEYDPQKLFQRNMPGGFKLG